MQLGDVWTALFPFADTANFKLRPVLVVGASPMGINQEEVILVAMITSKVQKSRIGDVPIPDHLAVGLTQPSLIKARRLASLSIAHFRDPAKRIGRIDDKTLSKVFTEITVLFDR